MTTVIELKSRNDSDLIGGSPAAEEETIRFDSLQTYHIMTWGCQMNEEDSEQMSLFMDGMGYRKTDSVERADVVLLNTCSVRAKPEEKVWSELGRLRELKQARPNMIVGVCGCMAQVESDEIRARAPYVDMVVGTGNISEIPELIRQVQEDGRETRLALDEQPKFKRYHAPARHLWAFRHAEAP